jgi:hypothetical protein
MLSVAAQLRHLADDTLCRADSSLYLMAAEALETRAKLLAEALPDEIPQATESPAMHLPVDMVI